MSNKTQPKGGEFLLRELEPDLCFTPEDFTDEHRMIKETTQQFVDNEVLPRLKEIEAKDESVVRSLMRQAGELGLLGTDVPEEFGGLGLDKVSTACVTEPMGNAASFAVVHGAHTGIGTLPIVYYGSRELKEKYLPGLASGEFIGAYCLTEPGAGSDAIGGCRTKAVLSEDGKHYILNGEKIFITNGGWADTYIVFAKIDGTDFSAFVLERSTPGLSTGAEEKKMGIHGSSTTPVVLEDAKVPVENLLYERGKGPAIAMNVLNIGRYKLGCAAVGGAKGALKTSVEYAKGRVQFGKAISEFGAIREKLATMAYRIYAAESGIYRTVGLIEAALEGVDRAAEDYPAKASAAIREYAIECSIDKVHGSEVLDYVVDECVQIHGGYGYSAEFPAERYYRDARINRIFEGTNEINRLTIPGEMLKRAMKGALPLVAAAQGLMDEIMEYSPLALDLGDEPLAYQAHMVQMMKKATLMVAAVAVQKFMNKIINEQEVLMRVADMIIETFVTEAVVARALKATSAGAAKVELHQIMAQLYLDEAVGKLQRWGNEVLAYVAQGDEGRLQAMALRKLLKYQGLDSISMRRRLAEAVIDLGRYPLD